MGIEVFEYQFICDGAADVHSTTNKQIHLSISAGLEVLQSEGWTVRPVGDPTEGVVFLLCPVCVQKEARGSAGKVAEAHAAKGKSDESV